MRCIRGTLRRYRRAADAGALHNRWLVGWRVNTPGQQLAVCVRMRAARRLGAPQCARAFAAVARLRARDDDVSGACCNFRSGRWFCLGNVLLTCSFRRLSALLRLFYDMLTPLSEHAATPKCVAQKVPLWRVHGCLLLVAELFDALRRIAGTSSLHRRAGAMGPSAHAWRCEAARVRSSACWGLA